MHVFSSTSRALCLSVCAIVFASTAHSNTTPDYATLANNPQWLALLHMRKGLDGHYRSEADIASFFLSGHSDDARAEMEATLQALQEDSNSKEITGAQSAWCQFPARAQFLMENIALQKPENLHCEMLDNWRQQFNHDELVLVFPEPYMQNVASIFGHTFLRFDATDKNTHPILLSKALSYYADVASAGNTSSYIIKGLGGGFDGIIEIATYFQKLRKYSDNEDRDIREYRLALSPAQIKTFIDHSWEVRGHTFHYFFLTENCSYRLIAMLDVVSPTHRVRERFNWDAMPVDTVTALRDSGLIADEKYIASARKKFYAQLAALDPAQREQLLALAHGELHDDDVDDLQVLSMAAQYNGMQMRTDSTRLATHEMQVATLVRRRYENGRLLPDIATAPQEPDPSVSGHRQIRLLSGWQHNDGDNFLLLGARAAYHDFHDPLNAYQKGVQLEVFDTVLRAAINADDNHGGKNTLQLDHMRWFSLNAYKARDDFFQPTSWGFSLSRAHEMTDTHKPLLHVIDGYRGMAFDCGELLCHSEIIGGVLGGSALDLGWTARTGLRAGALYQSNILSASFDVSEQKYLAGEHNTLSTVEAGVGYPLGRNTSLYGSYRYESNSDIHRNSFTFSLRQFF